LYCKLGFQRRRVFLSEKGTLFPNATSLPSYRPRVDRVERYRTGWLNVAVAVVFIVGDPRGMGKTDVSPINPGRVEPIRITAEGEAAMDGAVRARSEEKDRRIVLHVACVCMSS